MKLTDTRTAETGVRELCRASRPYTTPLPTLVFICPPLLPPPGAQRVNVYSGLGLQPSCLEPPGFKRACHSWQADALPGAHHLPLTPTGRKGSLSAFLVKKKPYPHTFADPVLPHPSPQPRDTEWHTCPSLMPYSNYYYRLYKGLSDDQRMAMTSIGH